MNGTNEAKLYFEKIKNIGLEGKNSIVYLARDKQLNAEIVVKEILKEHIKEMDPTEDYFKESRLLYLTKHPNICEVYWGASSDTHIYLSTPFYKNGSLESYMNKLESEGIPLRKEEIIKFSLEILLGLQYIHSLKLIHLDIKPTNILIDNSGKAIITDFGLTKVMDNNGLVKNDYFYQSHRPPEAIRVGDMDLRADIYQFGVTLYRMCCGNINFKKQLDDCKELSSHILKGSFPCRKELENYVDKKMGKIIKKCLEVEVNKRYNSVIEIMNDLAKIES